MRFIKGDSLKEAIERFHRPSEACRKHGTSPGRRNRELELRQLLRRFLDVCNAIDYAHSRGVLHRDIKPGNIIMGKHGETLVVDWGLAKPLGGSSRAGQAASARSRLPLVAVRLRPCREAPWDAGVHEPGTGRRRPGSARTAIRRLLARRTLYCLLTGRPPFESEDLGEVLRKVQQGDFPRRGRSIRRSTGLEAICLKAMASNARGSLHEQPGARRRRRAMDRRRARRRLA